MLYIFPYSFERKIKNEEKDIIEKIEEKHPEGKLDKLKYCSN